MLTLLYSRLKQHLALYLYHPDSPAPGYLAFNSSLIAAIARRAKGQHIYPVPLVFTSAASI